MKKKLKQQNRTLIMAKLAENPPPAVAVGDKIRIRWDTYHYEVIAITDKHIALFAKVLPYPYNISKEVRHSQEDLHYLTWRIEKPDGAVWSIPELYYVE